MEERRKNKRRDLSCKLMIKRLDSGIHDEFEVDITNLSKSGVGFKCDEILQIGSVYESCITIWTKEKIHCFVEIVRIEIKADTIDYGGIFIGMPDADLQRIEVYNIVTDKEDYL